jgi:hypothetical protein
MTPALTGEEAMIDADSERPVVFTHHARKRMLERGASERAVVEAIRSGVREPAQRGLVQFRLNFEYNRHWRGRFYAVQQVAPIVAEEEGRRVVITVYTFYFQEGEPS